MKSKLLTSMLCFGLFALLFFFTNKASANYPATATGGVNFNKSVSGGAYAASAPFSGSIPLTWCTSTYSTKDGTTCTGTTTGYLSSSNFTGSSSISWCSATSYTKDGSYCSRTTTAYGATTSGWYFQTYSCPSGGVLSGTTCLTDNGCAANTCNTTTCWNNLAWVSGTKVCADNSCAANTCTTSVCWNNLTWIPGTKPFSYGPAICTSSTTCSPDDCGKTIPKTYFCVKDDVSGCGGPQQSCDANSLCPSGQTIKCPACALEAGDWSEVKPQ